MNDKEQSDSDQQQQGENRKKACNDNISQSDLSQAGFTLVEITIVVVLIGLLASIAVPNFIKSRTTTHMDVCINNLRIIDCAIQQWALEEKRGANSAVEFADISAYMKRNVICPAGGASFADSYLISIVGEEPSCLKLPGSHLIASTINVAAVSSSGGSSGGSSGSAGSGSSGSSGGSGNSGHHGNNGQGHGHGP